MWFIYSLITLFFWGAADMFYKLSADKNEKYTHLKTAVAVGMIMGLHAVFYYFTTDGIGFGLTDLVKYLPVSACYIVSMIVGYFGLRYLTLSVSSPIQNSSGFIVALLALIFFSRKPTPLGIAAIILLSAGVFALSFIESREEADERKKAEKKYTSSVFAVTFPLLYCVIDAAGTFLDGLYLDEKGWMSEDAALLAYEVTFFIVGVVCLVYLIGIKKEKFTLRSEAKRYAAAALETAGQFTYVYAMASSSTVAAPMISAYCVVSMLLSAIFLKEKLSAKKYAVIAVIVVGIVIMGIAE